MIHASYIGILFFFFFAVEKAFFVFFEPLLTLRVKKLHTTTQMAMKQIGIIGAVAFVESRKGGGAGAGSGGM